MKNTEKIEYEIKVHSKLAKKYQDVLNYPGAEMFHNYWNNEILKLAQIKQNMLVLDLGCGSGILLKDLKVGKIFGLDVSLDMLKIARKYNKNIAQGISENLPFKDSLFDVVICRGSIHHFYSYKLGLNEIKRVLKNNGRLIISEPFENFLLYLPRKIAKYAKRFEKHNILDKKRFFDYLKKIGFAVKYKEYFGYFAMPILFSPDIFFLFKLISLNRLLSKLLIDIDKLISKIPIVRKFSWHINVVLDKFSQ